MSDTEVYAFTDIEFDGPVPGECQWFLLCHEPATHMVSHPILEWVPTCDVHAAWVRE